MRTLLAILILVAPGFGASFALQYEVVSLGTLGGISSEGFALNGTGVAVGRSALPSSVLSGFIFDGFSSSNLSWAAGAFESQARDVNESGTAAGTSYTGQGARATVWENGQASLPGTLGGGASYGNAVNDRGQLVGGSTTSSGAGHAFMYENGTWTDIGSLWGDAWSAAYDINNSGSVTGVRETAPGVFRSFIWDGVSVITLDTLGGTSSYGFAISSDGSVVGNASVASGHMHGYLYAGGVMIDLGTLGGDSSYAYGINDAGWVVGHSWLAGGSTMHAYVWIDGQMVDLNNVLVGAAGWELLEAYDINSSGQIVGTGLYQGQRTGFRLDPIGDSLLSNDMELTPNPEPGTLTMVALGCGLLAFGAWRRRRRR